LLHEQVAICIGGAFGAAELLHDSLASPLYDIRHPD
jgi:hypothetical protein